MKKISNKHAVELANYKKQHEEWFKKPENCFCQLRVKGCTFNKQLTVHHKKGRGKFLLDESSWVSLCMNCHRWVHDNDKEARELGLLL